MTTSLRHRRRAERFAQLLDEASGGRRQHLRSPLDDELAELVALRHELVSRGPGPDIDQEFRTGLRAMLVATAEREGIGRTAQPEPDPPAPRRSRRAVPPTGQAPAPASPTPRPARGPRARIAVLAGVAVGAVAFTGMSTASEGAVPGDPLYGVKRSTERAQLALASSDVGRGQLYLDFARTRLAEAHALASDLDRVLDDMDRDTRHGVQLLTAAAVNRQDPTALEVVDAFTTSQRDALAELAGHVTGADRNRLTSSLGLLDAIEDRTGELRQSLQECAAPSATSIDSLGPVPDECVALPPPSALAFGRERANRPADPARQPSSQPNGSGAVAQPSPAEPTGTAKPLTTAGPTGEADRPSLPAGPQPGDGPTEPEADGGLLTGLNRLLGNLLGG